MGLSSKKVKTTESQTLAPNAVYAPQINDAAAQLRPAYDQSMGILKKYQPGFDKARGYSEDLLSGKFLSGNPFLQKVLDRTNSDIRDSLGGAFSDAGRYGSGYHAGTVADRIADNENRLRYQDYATERGYQNDAPGRVAQLATIEAGLPQAISGNYADAIAGILGKYIQGNSQGTSKSSGGFLGDLLLSSVGNIAKAVGGR